jgi:hypothetical protein
MLNDKMTKADRDALLSVARNRERVAKAKTAQHETVLKAEFEKQMAAIYLPSHHPGWTKVRQTAEETVVPTNVEIAAVCRENGIQAEFAPRVEVAWYSRSSSKERREELRKVAETEIKARIKQPRMRIAEASVSAQD